MSKFKVGDTVKFIEDYGKFKMGEIAKVTDIIAASNWGSRPGENFLLNVENSKNKTSCFEKRVELVKENEMSELEELCKKANAGISALFSLRNRTQEIEIYNLKFNCVDDCFKPDSPTSPIAVLGKIGCGFSNQSTVEFRVKSKPKFEPFYVNNGEWKVWKDEMGTHVGCQVFNSKALKKALKVLCTQNGAMFDFGEEKLQAMRNYVEHSSGYRITWSDAEKILAALEKEGE